MPGVAEWLDQWIEAHAVELKPSTVASYRQKIDSYLKPAPGRERLQSLSPARLSVLFKMLGEPGGKDGKPLSPRSVAYARAVLRKALQDAVVERLLAATEGSRWHVPWTLALATGMCRGQLVALRWAHLDLEAGIVAVEVAITEVAGELVEGTPKNHEQRKVAPDPRTVELLKRWRIQQATERLAWGPQYTAHDRVFVWENGSPVLPNFVTKAFQGHAERVRRRDPRRRHTGRLVFAKAVWGA